MGDGYGSECHLLRYLGRHRRALDAAVGREAGAEAVAWCDYPFDAGRPWHDGEWKGVDFLPKKSAAREAWAGFWPPRGNPPNWDAVGKVRFGERWEWLLIEAKAHLDEMRSDCMASEAGGRPMIRAAFDRVKAALGAPSAADWTVGHYQYANRVSTLWHLLQHDEPARLIFVYFTGDRFPGAAANCPADAQGWRDAIEERRLDLGLPKQHMLADRIHDIYLPVAGSR